MKLIVEEVFTPGGLPIHTYIARDKYKLEEKFKDLSEAYEVLSNSEKKSTYDLAQKMKNNTFADAVSSFFAEMENELLNYQKREMIIREKLKEFKKSDKWYKYSLLAIIETILHDKDEATQRITWVFSMLAYLIFFIVVTSIISGYSWYFIIGFAYLSFSTKQSEKLMKLEKKLWREAGVT